MVPIYTYALMKEEYGVVDLIFTTCSLALPFVTLNIQEAVLRFSLDQDADKTTIFSSSLLVVSIGSILSICTIPILSRIKVLSDYVVIFMCYLIVSSFYYLVNLFLKGCDKQRLFVISSILLTLITSILNIVFLIVLKYGIIGFVLSNIISLLITMFYMIFKGKLIEHISVRKIDFLLIKEMLKYSYVLIPNSVMWWVVNASDRYLISVFLGLKFNGLYVIAYKLPSLMNMVSSIFIQAWQLSAIKEIDSNDKEEYFSFVFLYLTQGLVIVCSFFLLVARPILKFYVASAYFEAWKYVPFLLVAFLFGALSSFLAANYLAAKKNKGNMLSTIFGGCINIGLNIFLIPSIGLYGAAFSTMISYIFIFIYRVIDTRKIVVIESSLINNMQIVILIILQMVLYYIRTPVGTMLSVFIFVLIVILNRKIVLQIIEICKEKLKKIYLKRNKIK